MRSGSIIMLAVAVAGCSSETPPPPATPSVLVSVAVPQRGSLPDRIMLYGTAAPTPAGIQALSILQPGRVTAVTVVAGAMVRRGQPLVTIGVSPDTIATFRQAQTALSVASAQRATTAQLLTQQLATRDQLAQADKAVADATAVLDAQRAAGGGAASRTLVAPFDGIATAVTAVPGDRPVAGAALVTVARRGAAVVTAGVDPALRARLHVGQPAQLIRVGGGAPVTGRIAQVGGVLNPRTRLVDLQFAYPAGAILPGEAVQVGVDVVTVAGWIVPHRAVVTADGAAHVFQVAGGKAVGVAVAVRLAGAIDDVVDGPIDPARPLIVDGAYQVGNGDAVHRAPARPGPR